MLMLKDEEWLFYHGLHIIPWEMCPPLWLYERMQHSTYSNLIFSLQPIFNIISMKTTNHLMLSQFLPCCCLNSRCLCSFYSTIVVTLFSLVIIWNVFSCFFVLLFYSISSLDSKLVKEENKLNFLMFNVSECSDYTSTSMPPSEPCPQSHRAWDLHFIVAPSRAQSVQSSKEKQLLIWLDF